MRRFRTYLSRRRFLIGAAAPAWMAALDPPPSGEWDGPAVIRKVYLGGRPSWPRPDLDLAAEVAALDARLDGLARRYPGKLRLTGGDTVMSQSDTTVTFTVAAGAQDPKLTRTLTTRYWTQLERLASRNPDTGLAFKPDWPIYLRANLAANEAGRYRPMTPSTRP